MGGVGGKLAEEVFELLWGEVVVRQARTLAVPRVPIASNGHIPMRIGEQHCFLLPAQEPSHVLRVGRVTAEKSMIPEVPDVPALSDRLLLHFRDVVRIARCFAFGWTEQVCEFVFIKA